MKPDKLLYGKNEFYPNLNNKIYEIYKIDNIKKEKKMITIFKKFIKNQKNNIDEQHFIGIDFEFNKVSKNNRDVALMQINIENNSTIGYIFLLYPPDLEYNTHKKLIKILTTPTFIKILHGSESLDIPYLFNQLLIKKKLVNKFCINFYDTKFICDYINLSQSIDKPKSCSIYDFLVDNKIITKEQNDMLDKNEELMGPIYLININVYELNDSLFNYTLYDVLYLPQLIKKFINLKDNNITIILELTALVNKYKRNIENDFNNLESLINTINNYFIYYNNKKYTLQSILNIFLIDKISNLYFDIFKKINYFKNFFKIITKYIIYYNIFLQFKIYKNNNNIFITNDFDQYFTWLKSYLHLYKIIILYNKSAINFINNKFSKYNNKI